MPGVKDETIRKYLLNDLPEAERERFEEQYFEHDEIYRRMQFLEGELISEYTHGRLTAPERQAFESHHLATLERRQRVETVRRWNNVIASSAPQRLSLRLTKKLRDRIRSLGDLMNFRTMLVAALAVMFLTAAAVVWSYLNHRQRQELTAGVEMAAAGAKPADHRGEPGPEVVLHLTAATPGREASSLTLPESSPGAVLVLPGFHEEGIKTCVLELYRGEATGTPIWKTEISGARSSGQPIRVKTPKTTFGDGGLHTIRLTGYLTEERERQRSLTETYRVEVNLK
ncbi:MAG TPA: hypothetical protein VJ302_10975 [Blastocatellia bacterium]|nr:hypothetical protein [Blastocatellia bacterium]